GSDGLVDDDVLAGLEGLGGEVEVGLAGCGDNDEIDGGVGEGFAGGAEDARLRVGAGGVVTFALNDGGELEAGDRGDERRMKDLAGKAEAENSAANGRFGRGAHGEMVRRDQGTGIREQGLGNRD